MQFTIEREQLLKPLQLINGVVNKRQTLPILGNVLLVAKDNMLSLTGTDLEVELTSYTDLLTSNIAGDITVPARKLFDICRSLPDDSQLKIKLADNRLYLTTENSRFSLNTLPAEQFPRAQETAAEMEVTLNIMQLRQMTERTQFAMAQQDVRYYLNGSLWQIEQGTFITVATDGHRLSYCRLPIADNGEKKVVKVIIPRKAIIEVMRILPEVDGVVKLVIGTNHMRVVSDNFMLTSKLIDGRFPDYHNVIPRSGNNHLCIDRDVLKPVLSRVAILSSEKYRGIRLSVEENLLKVSANNPEHEEAEESINVDYSGETIEVGLNVNYLIDILNSLPKGKILFTLISAEKSILIKHQNDPLDALNIIMPMRL